MYFHLHDFLHTPFYLLSMECIFFLFWYLLVIILIYLSFCLSHRDFPFHMSLPSWDTYNEASMIYVFPFFDFIVSPWNTFTLVISIGYSSCLSIILPIYVYHILFISNSLFIYVNPQCSKAFHKCLIMSFAYGIYFNILSGFIPQK